MKKKKQERQEYLENPVKRSAIEKSVEATKSSFM